MAGSRRVIDEVSLIVADRTVNADGSGAHGSAQFYVDVTAITRTTGSLTVTVRWRTNAGTTVTVATLGSITATGVYRLTPTANVFDTAGRAIPEPTQANWDLGGDATDVSGIIYAIYGN